MSRYTLALRNDRPARAGIVSAAMARTSEMISAWMARQELARQRRRLLELDDYLLKDIGLSRADAEREAMGLDSHLRG